MMLNSFTPWLTKLFTSLIISGIGTEVCRPVIRGIAQKAQKRLQPSEIFM